MQRLASQRRLGFFALGDILAMDGDHVRRDEHVGYVQHSLGASQLVGHLTCGRAPGRRCSE